MLCRQTNSLSSAHLGYPALAWEGQWNLLLGDPRSGPELACFLGGSFLKEWMWVSPPSVFLSPLSVFLSPP